MAYGEYGEEMEEMSEEMADELSAELEMQLAEMDAEERAELADIFEKMEAGEELSVAQETFLGALIPFIPTIAKGIGAAVGIGKKIFGKKRRRRPAARVSARSAAPMRPVTRPTPGIIPQQGWICVQCRPLKRTPRK